MGEVVEVSGISIEVNDKLALRPFGTAGRRWNECLPEHLIVRTTPSFLKKGDKPRIYVVDRPIPLVSIGSDGQHSAQLGLVRILNYTTSFDGKDYTTNGRYEIVSVEGK